MCPYCREMILDSDQQIACSLCSTLHHQECWAEADHCSIYGCGGEL
ncbi:MAG: RING finger protein [Acidobacteriota bacterium]